MTITPVNVGTTANDHTGSSLRLLAQTVNLIITELAAASAWILTRRRRLTGAETYYVNTTGAPVVTGGGTFATGNDSNNGRSYAAPFATLARAEQERTRYLDFNGQAVVCLVAPSTSITERFIFNGRGHGQIHQSDWIYRGDMANTPPTTHKVSTALPAFNAARGGFFRVEGFVFETSSTTEHAAKIYDLANIEIGNCVAKGAFGHWQVAGGFVTQTARNYGDDDTKHGITGEVGGGKWDFGGYGYGHLNTPVYSGDRDSAFLNFGEGCEAAVHSYTYSGTFTGKPYHLTAGGRIVPEGLRDAMGGTLPGVVTLPSAMESECFLTLASGDAHPASDQSAKSTVYLTPDRGNMVPYAIADTVSGATLGSITIAELSLALDSSSGHTGYHQNGGVYDVWTYTDPTTGDIKLATGPKWTDVTTRGYSISQNRGIWSNVASIQLRFGTNSGDLITVPASCAILHGAFECTADGQTSDTVLKRLLDNVYNWAPRHMAAYEPADSWTYSTFAFQLMNANANNTLRYLHCLPGRAVEAETAQPVSSNVAISIFVGVGLDSTTAHGADSMSLYDTAFTTITGKRARYQGKPGVGTHTLSPLEHGGGSNTQTWYGDGGAPTKVRAGIQALA